MHDSFWTHARDVETMNALLREEFIKMHERPLLDELRAELAARHVSPREGLPKPPKRGQLDLAAVRRADYFFS